MKLTAVALKSLVDKGEKGKHFIGDGSGLYLLVERPGAGRWQRKFSFNGKPAVDSLGKYPIVPLAKARELALNSQKLVLDGINPIQQRMELRTAESKRSSETLRAVAEKWIEKYRGKTVETTSKRVWASMENYLLKHRKGSSELGSMPISLIGSTELAEVLELLEKRGKAPTARKLLTAFRLLFRYAKVVAKAVHVDPTDGLEEVLSGSIKERVKHRPAITDPAKLGEFLRSADGYGGNLPSVRAALKLLPLVFLRSKELRGGRWEEIDWENKVWRVPSARMKRTRGHKATGKPHIVPLADQTLAVLKELYLITGTTGLIFKGLGAGKRAISENTLTAAIRRLGYDTKHEVSCHGFRATARTLGVQYVGISSHLLELQLAHASKEPLGEAYDRADFMPDRVVAMQQWADYLDGLRSLPRSVVSQPGEE